MYSNGLCFTAAILAALFSFLAINTDWFPPSSPPHTALLVNLSRSVVELIPIHGGGFGPESYAFDPLGGGPYTGISDGRIVKWNQQLNKWLDFAITSPNRTGCGMGEKEEEREEQCGRPLGLGFRESNGDLYIADAYMGLLTVASNGGLANKIPSFQTQTHRFDSPNFAFVNALDIDQLSGDVYYTHTSTIYQRRNYVGAILSGDKTGRVMKYDAKSNQIKVLLGNLSFPNGISLSKNGDFLLISETTKCRILKYWLKTEKAGTYEIFADNLPGFPDNIKISKRGGFWVGIHSTNQGLFRIITLSHSWLGKALVKIIPLNVIMRIHSCLATWIGKAGLGIRLSDESGEVIEMVEQGAAKSSSLGFKLKSISEIQETDDGVLWIGSIDHPFAAKVIKGFEN